MISSKHWKVNVKQNKIRSRVIIIYLQAVEPLKMVLLGRLQELFIVSLLTNDRMLEELNMLRGIMGKISLVENQWFSDAFIFKVCWIDGVLSSLLSLNLNLNSTSNYCLYWGMIDLCTYYNCHFNGRPSCTVVFQTHEIPGGDTPTLIRRCRSEILKRSPKRH